MENAKPILTTSEVCAEFRNNASELMLAQTLDNDQSDSTKPRYTPSAYEIKVMEDAIASWMKQRKHGFTIQHDLAHQKNELAFAAAAYAIYGVVHPRKLILNRDCRELWPWEDWFKPKDRRENLLRATAFLLSEIVRLDVETEQEISRSTDAERLLDSHTGMTADERAAL